jgi:hypothetical protein
VVLHVAQKKEAESFLDFLAVMEGFPVLNRPAAIPVDRLLREKALDLYRFIEKVVRTPPPAEDQQKGSPRQQRGKNLGNRQRREYRSCSACHSKTIPFPSSDGSRKVTENDIETPLPRASQAAFFRALAAIWNNDAVKKRLFDFAAILQYRGKPRSPSSMTCRTWTAL